MAPKDGSFDLESRNKQMYHFPDVCQVQVNLDLDLEEQIKVQQLRIDLQDKLVNMWEERIKSVKSIYNDFEEWLNMKPYEMIVSEYLKCSESGEFVETVKARGEMIKGKEERIKELQEGVKVLVCCSETEEWDELIKEQEGVIKVQEGRIKVFVESVNWLEMNLMRLKALAEKINME